MSFHFVRTKYACVLSCFTFTPGKGLFLRHDFPPEILRHSENLLWLYCKSSMLWVEHGPYTSGQSIEFLGIQMPIKIKTKLEEKLKFTDDY